MRGTWVYYYSPASQSSTEPYEKTGAMLEAIYFTEDFESVRIPEKYAGWIQYGDFMIDTSEGLFIRAAGRRFISGSREEDEYYEEKDPVTGKYIHFSNTKYPCKDRFEEAIRDIKYKYKAYNGRELDSLVRRDLAHTAQFKTLLKDAVDESLKLGYGGEELEHFAELFGLKKEALMLKRERIVNPTCGEDLSAWDHLGAITRLAAETGTWHVFLKGFLQIMGESKTSIRFDYFPYTEGRRSFAAELDTINLDVASLLLGTYFYLEKPGKNHFQYPTNFEEAIYESKYRKEIEQKMIDAICDKELDNLNRIAFCDLYASYVTEIPDSISRKESADKLRKVLPTLPSSFSHYARDLVDDK